MDGATWFGRNASRILNKASDEVCATTGAIRDLCQKILLDEEIRERHTDLLHTVDGAVLRAAERVEKLLDRTTGLAADAQETRVPGRGGESFASSSFLSNPMHGASSSFT